MGATRDGRRLRPGVPDRAKWSGKGGQKVGEALQGDWVTVSDPDPNDTEDNASSSRGRARGGAKFIEGEGCTFRGGSVVFGSSEGGAAGLGQVWQSPDLTTLGI